MAFLWRGMILRARDNVQQDVVGTQLPPCEAENFLRWLDIPGTVLGYPTAFTD
jgi:hypothetical protein